MHIGLEAKIFIEYLINKFSKALFSYSHTHNNFVVGPEELYFVEAMLFEIKLIRNKPAILYIYDLKVIATLLSQ